MSQQTELLDKAPEIKSVTGGFDHDRDVENGKEEWLTPPQIIRALGEFDLDPCAPIKRPWDTARNHFTIRENGLLKQWSGRVWCNPPYGGKTSEWLGRCAEHKNVTALIFARTETDQFFDHIWPSATAVCFLHKRIAFYEFSCANCGKGISQHGEKKSDHYPVSAAPKVMVGGAAGSPSMLVVWDELNRVKLLDACLTGKLDGKFVEL